MSHRNEFLRYEDAMGLVFQDSVYWCRKKELSRFVRFFVRADNFLCSRDREQLFLQKLEIFYWRSRKYGLPEISTFQIIDGQLFSTQNSKKTQFFWVWGCYGAIRGAPATSLNSVTLWGSWCLKTSFVVFVAENCWFYQNPKKIGTTNENWVVLGAWAEISTEISARNCLK